MKNWKTKFIDLLLEDEVQSAYALLREYVIDEEDIINCVHQLCCLAIEFEDDQYLTSSLDVIIRKLELALPY
jgi:hypothetical protein